MCGIAGFVIKDPIGCSIDREALLDALLWGIDHRGGDATGFVARNREGMIEWQKASTDVKGFLPFRRRLPVDCDVVLAHTRWATNGHQAFPENNHPVKRGPIFVTHNGIVWNDAQLFRLTSRKPYGQVDSEAIAAVLSHCGTLDERTGDVLGDIDGSAAIAALDERDGTVLLARITQSPLYVLSTRRVTMWGSTAKTVEDAHKRVIGSLGRNRAVQYAEGDALLLKDGKGQRFTFAPPGFSWHYGKATNNETTGSYLPARAAVTTAQRLEESYQRAVTFHRSGLCEVCGEPLHDAYDLWEDDDCYEVCEPCWNAYSDPRDRDRMNRSATVEWEARK